MKLIFSILALSAVFTVGAYAQTTISNLDDDPITNPNSTSTNLRSWGSSTGSLVGCSGDCQVTGSLAHSSTYSVDGQSLQLTLNNPTGCTSNCYGDVDFSNKIYQNNATASDANDFTLDMYVTTDSVGNSKSQAIEFTIEQDVPSTRVSGAYWDRYIYSWQCNHKGNGTWNLWNGAGNDGAGQWVQAKTTSGATVPCSAFSPAGSFTHFYFHFTRLPDTHQIEFLDFTEVNSAGTSLYYKFDTTEGIQAPQPNWGTGLFTALQLDGDYAQDQYSVWADKWLVAYQ